MKKNIRKAKAGKQLSSTPFILVLIGVILGFFGTLSGVARYIFFRSDMMNAMHNTFIPAGFDLNVLLLLGLIFTSIGLILTIISLVFLLRIKNAPAKNDFIVLIVLGSMSVIVGSFLSGVLILTGGIIGVVQLNKN